MAAWRHALENDPRLRPFIIPNVRSTGTTLGGGSYGSVEELTINGFICAGKKVHEILLQVGNYGADFFAQRYVEECRLMSDLRHPHLVQFMGVCFLPDSSLPVLVMERLLISLDDLLENTADIPLALKRSFLADVAKGLEYLHNHSPPVIHRDLTAKNVLLNSAMVAKVSDLGNSRIVDFRPGQLARTLSRIPGTMVYMPPEAFDDTSRYGTSLDIFSFGHLALFTVNQVFPGVLKSIAYPDPNDPDNLIARNELTRREDYIDQLHQQLGDGHSLVQMIKQCLHNVPARRPSTEDVLERLEGIRDQIQDPYFHMTKLEMMLALKQKDHTVQQLSSQLQTLTGGSTQEDLEQLETDDKDRMIRLLRTRLQEKESQLQRLQSESSTQLAARDSLRASMREEMENQIGGKERGEQAEDAEISRLQGELQSQLVGVPAKPIIGLTLPLRLYWRRCKDMPYGREDPHAVVIQQRVYVGGGRGHKERSVVMVYDPHSDQWSLLSPYQFRLFGMAAINQQLVLVGGRDDSGKTTNQLGVWDENSHQWTERYPPMMTACFDPSVFAREEWLVVAGGYDGDALDRVEILNATTRQWHSAAALPLECNGMRSALFGDTIYVIGGWHGLPIKSMFTISLSALIRQATTLPRAATPAATQTLWQTLPPTPLGLSAPLVLNGSLLAIGGQDDKRNPSSAIHLYQPGTGKWDKVGDLPAIRRSCACVLLPSGRLLVLGGEDDLGTMIACADMAILQ